VIKHQRLDFDKFNTPIDQVMTMEGEFLIQTISGFNHYCIACKTIHPCPNMGWDYNGNAACPTFSPSFKQWLHDYYDGRIDEYVRASGICHYNITLGRLIYHPDSTHEYAGRIVNMTALPEYFHTHFM
jgi:hypothetical protein